MRLLIFIFFIFQSGLCAKTGSPSHDSFTSSIHLGMAGAGFLHPSSIALKVNPSCFIHDRVFTTAIIKYPANITSQSVGYSSPWNKGYFSISVKHLSYGTFTGYNDEAIFTEVYSASDTWASIAYARIVNNTPFTFGSNCMIYSSSLHSKQFRVIKFSIGGKINFKNMKSIIGISIHEIGKELLNGDLIKIYPRLVFSGSKTLEYLPLTIYCDLLSSKRLEEIELFIGGFFRLKNNFKIRFGTSTRKIEQNIQKNIIKSILGSSGFGFSYDTGSILISYGTYFYGTGIQASGLEIEIGI